MARKETPGYVFALPTGVGYVVGLVTHYIPKFGAIVWISRKVFADLPTLAEADAITLWRYPVIFPASTAVANGNAVKLGMKQIPDELKEFPRLRAGASDMGWWEVTADPETGRQVTLGRTNDRRLPTASRPNSAALREDIETDWSPEQEF